MQWYTVSILVLSWSAVGAPSEDQRFEALAKRYLDESPALYPVSATRLGDHRFDDRLDQISEQARQRQAVFARKYLAELAGIRREELSPANQVDWELLEHELSSTLFDLEVLREWEWNPLSYTQLAGNAVYGMMARDFAPLPERLVKLTSRLEQFPRLLGQVRATLLAAKVPAVHAGTAVKQNRGVLTILEHMVQPHEGKLPKEARDRLKGAVETARAAIEKHQSWLEQELLPGATGNFRLGVSLYDQKLAATLNAQLSRQEIRQRAESELVRVRGEMVRIARQVYAKEYPYTQFPEKPSKQYRQAVIRAALELAYRDRPERGRIVQATKRSLQLSTDFVRRAGLVTVPPDPVEIIIMPEFRRGVSLAYCDSPGPLDAGQKTFYAVAPLPEEWTEKQVGSFLREYNLRSLHNLTVHEAMPGHFLQLAHSNRYPSLLRRVLASGVFIEGWAVYAEQMMVEQGFLDRDPLMKLIVLKWYLRGIANAIMDQRIHAEDMTREQAMELMIEQTFQEEREAAAKWVRAQLTSTQLSTYFVGVQEHWDLRREVQKLRGQNFRLKEYHDQVLSFGSPPVRYVRSLLLKNLTP